MDTSQLNDEMLIEVFNISTGSVSYYSELSRMKRRWDKSNALVNIPKKVPLNELRELVSSSGGYELLTRGLLIKDMNIRKDLGLPIDKEYLLDDDGIKDLLTKSPKIIRDTMKKAPKTINEKVANIAIETELSDLNKLEVIKEYSSIDCLYVIQENKETKKEEKLQKQNKKTQSEN